ncbi:MAG TPA: hypothetical protein VMD99_15975 [Terriglobales bacterium]|nr:hypothetical protein [Terriglobales bacterium]
MPTSFPRIGIFLFLTLPLMAQGRRVWVLRASGEMVEYDPATFAVNGTVKVPAEAAASPQNVAVNRAGQILFAAAVSLPVAEEDVSGAHKAWVWNGKTSTAIDMGLKREVGETGSNQAVTELAPAVFLAADGMHLYWFANSARRLQREDFDLSIMTTWLGWRTGLSGEAREELSSVKLPDCRCPTGACEESCPVGVVWVPDDGVGDFFLLTQFVAGKTGGVYKASTLYKEDGGKWTGSALADPVRRVLDAANGGDVIVEAIPDTGCCGWANESDDQTVVRRGVKKLVVFDELAAFRNPDYDVSFFTSNAKLSPELDLVGMTITATATVNQTIQLAEQGQANPEESKAIRKSLGELPAVEVKSVEDSPKRVAFLPHATLVGWISEKELLIVEDHLLVVYDIGTGRRRKSNVRVQDAGRVFLR